LISYSRTDIEFVRRLHQAFLAIQRKVWIDWASIPPSAEWMNEILSAIEAADAVIFVVSPDSVESSVCRAEIDHARDHNKRLLPLVVQEVDPSRVPEFVTKLNWIFSRAADDFGLAFNSLVQALDTDLEWVRAHTRLLTKAREWDASARDGSLLLRGRDLKDAEEWLERASTKEPRPTAQQIQYVFGSRRHETSRKNLILGGVIMALIIVSVVAAIAHLQYRTAEARRRLATSRQAAAQSRNFLDRGFDVALLLALEAAKIDDTFEAAEALMAGMVHHPRLAYLMHGQRGSAGSLARSPDGRMLATAGNDSITLWDLTSRQAISPLLADHKGVMLVAFSPDGKVLASASATEIVLWDILKHERLRSRPLDDQRQVSTLYGLTFNPTGDLLAWGTFASISLWNLNEPDLDRAVHRLKGHSASVTSLAFSPDGRTLVSGSWQLDGEYGRGHAIVWDMRSRRRIRQLFGGGSMILSLAYAADGRVVASGEEDGTIRFWNTATWAQLGPALVRHASAVTNLAFSPVSQILASGSSDATVMLWDVATLEAINQGLTAHRRAVTGVVFTVDGERLATSDDDGTIAVWNVGVDNRLGLPVPGSQGVASVAFRPDGKFLATGGDDGTVAVFDAISRMPTRKFGVGRGFVYGLAFSPDNKTLVSGDWAGTIAFWDAESHQPLGTLLSREGGIVSLSFSPDGATLASASSAGAILLWDVRSRAVRGPALEGHTKHPVVVAFSPDGTLLASGGWDSKVIIWDVRTHKPRGVPRAGHQHPVIGLAFSPDGRMLASGSGDGTILLWDVERSEASPQLLLGRQEGLTSLSFSPDGRTLASGNTNRSVVLWDVAARRPLGPALLLRPPVRESGDADLRLTNAVLSPNGKVLAAGSRDTPLFLWDVDIESWRNLACRIANRNFRCNEWLEYLGSEPYRPTCPQLPSPECRN
jgi:WD40 repeat protein